MRKILFLMIAFLIIYCAKKKPLPSDLPQGLPKGQDIAVIETKFGKIYVDLLEDMAPKHSENFKKLIENQFYQETSFHKIIPQVFIMGGDPLSKDDNIANDGKGGTGYTIPAEISEKHTAGTLAAARTLGDSNPEKASNGCQFFICLNDLPELDDEYTVFGKVVHGLDVAEKISMESKNAFNHPINEIKMNITLIHIEE